MDDNVISLDAYRSHQPRYAETIKKLVDGEIVECLNIDALSLDLQAQYLKSESDYRTFDGLIGLIGQLLER